MFLVGWLAARVLKGERSEFILELPPIRWPRFGNLLTKTRLRVWWYLGEAVPLFLVGTVAAVRARPDRRAGVDCRGRPADRHRPARAAGRRPRRFSSWVSCAAITAPPGCSSSRTAVS